MDRTAIAPIRRETSRREIDAASLARAPGEDLRCGCHRLLARAVAEGIELRCARCKTNSVLGWDVVRRLEVEARASGHGAALLHGPCDKVGDRG